MSLLTMGRGRHESRAQRAAQEPADRSARPAPTHQRRAPGPHELGDVTLQAVDQLTGMTAEEVERLAERLVAAAEDVAASLRDCARQVREAGVAANVRLATFVRVANACAEGAKLMQARVARHDDLEAPELAPDELAPVEPHDYVPSALHMGDCSICGHVQDSPLHRRPAEAPASSSAAGPAADLDELARQIGVEPDDRAGPT